MQTRADVKRKYPGAFIKVTDEGYEGYLRKLVHGKRERSDLFKGRTLNELYRQFDNWKALGGFNAIAERRTGKTITVREFFIDWLDTKKAEWSGTTTDLHNSIFNTHIRDNKIANIELRDFEALGVVKFLNSLEGVSENTIYRVHKLMRSAFAWGIETEKLKTNPALAFSKAANKKKAKADVIALTEEHEQQLLSFVEGNDEWEALILLFLDGGLRMQEALGLKYDKVNFKNNQISIHRTLDTIEGTPVLKQSTKTPASKRDIILSDSTMIALKRLQGLGIADNGHVFTNDGALWTRHAFEKRFARLMIDAGLYDFTGPKGKKKALYTAHQLRHTCATSLLRAGHYLTSVSARLGHERPSITLDIYSNAIPKDDQKLADAFEARVRRIP